MPSAGPSPAAWPVLPAPTELSALPVPPVAGKTWRPLRQHWQRGAPVPRPGWARIFWRADGLVFEWVFLGAPAGNRARRLNEPTWELGDVGEAFVQVAGRADYGEFHVTPENQRLQLCWPAGGLAELRSGAATLERFTLGSGAGLTSSAVVREDHWAARLSVPAQVLGLDQLGPETILRAAVCRYDCGPGATALNSSTAPLRELSFHRQAEWDLLTLLLT